MNSEPISAILWGPAAYDHLLKADERMAALTRRQGVLHRELPRDPFGRLVRAIVGQQISGTAAAAIARRLEAEAGLPLTPERLAELRDDAYRAAGFSANKLAAVRDLTARTLDGRLDLAHVATLPDEDVRSQLIAVKGIGRWTADMFLMFSLGRPDVFPAEDLGIRNAVKRLYGGDVPTPKAARALAVQNGWHPYATAASFYLWKSLEDPELETEGWWNA